MKLPFVSLLILPIFFVACSASSVGHVAGKTISTAGSVASKTTVAVLKTSGHVAASTTKTVVQTSSSVATTVGKTAFITFKDTTTGVSKQIPYSQGMRLYAASQTAKFDMAIKSFQVMRSGKPMVSARFSSVMPGTNTDPVLVAGDVVQFSSAAKKPRTVAR